MKNIKKFLKNKKGFFSILFVILAFIALLVINGLVDIMKQTYVINEVQGIMDVAGISGLNSSVDKEALRQEEFIYDEDVAKNVFREIVNQRISNGETISSYKILRLEVSEKVDSSWGLGEGVRDGQQLFLDSTMLVRIHTSPIFDLFPSVQKNFYNAYSNDTFTITVSGETENGETELIIRSVSRLVYR